MRSAAYEMHMPSIPRLPSLLDGALDRALLGYGNVGFLARRPGWQAIPHSLDGKVAIVTGAKTGLGRATAKGLAELGATVRLAVRGREDGERVRAELEAEVPGAALAVDELDVSSLAAVRAYAAAFEGPLHVLVHNAGVMPAEREETPEGHERMLATHVLGPHLLTKLLRPRLREGVPSRVIWVSSGGMYSQRLRADDLQYQRGEYKPTAGYARTKRAQVVLAELWAKELRGDGIVVHAMHPGWSDTPGVAASLPGFRRIAGPILRTHEQGADTIVWLAAADEPARSSGGFWHDRRERPTHYAGRNREDEADRRALWAACEALTA
jgi:NAD(P)-dependent dehydrogenase (short-subunit alcohol dehydrogenase family)